MVGRFESLAEITRVSGSRIGRVRNPNLSGHYEGERGKNYARWQLGISAGMGAVKARHFHQFIRETDTVLDFGCGGGDLLLALTCARRLGVEPNEVAREVASGSQIEVSPTLASVPGASVDVVVTSHALEHCTRPLDELHEMRRVLKPEGRLVLLLPLDDWRTQRLYDPGDINHHLYAWTPQLLGNLLTDAGFSLERIRIVTHAWPPLVRLWRRLPDRLFDAICFAWSVLSRRRQIHGTCRPSRL